MQLVAMAMRAVRRRRKKTLPWPLVVWGLVIANIVVACYYSKVTVIRRIMLDGVRKSERQRLDKVLNEITGIPALRVDPRAVEGAFLAQSRVAKADFRRNVFGGSLLRLEYRTPIAKLSGYSQTFIDANGVIFWDPEGSSDVPKLKLAIPYQVTVGTIAGVIELTKLVKAIKLVPTKLNNLSVSANSIEVEYVNGSGVLLNLNDSIVVIGLLEQLDQKFDALAVKLASNPELIQVPYELNFMNYLNPSQRLLDRKKSKVKPETETTVIEETGTDKPVSPESTNSRSETTDPVTNPDKQKEKTTEDFKDGKKTLTGSRKERKKQPSDSTPNNLSEFAVKKDTEKVKQPKEKQEDQPKNEYTSNVKNKNNQPQ